MRCTSVFLLLAVLSACTDNLPSVDATISPEARAADYPALVPLPDLIARSQTDSTIEVETERLAARVARLKARARALQGRSIIDGATRLRLINAVKDRPA